MASTKTVVYECKACGTEVTVNSAGIQNLSPLYCCGKLLSEKKSKAAKKTPMKSPVKTAASQKTGKQAARKPMKKVAAKTSKKK